MNKESRFDSDAISSLDKKPKRGKLTLFLGVAAGAGKTYAMLEAAKERISEGLDVAVGLINTHGHTETEALLEGMEVISPRCLEYQEKNILEMDLDGVLRRHPQVILVDDLAHTNIQGARHQYRYLDVEELLESGIDVYTTLNIQSVQSLNDTVAQITGIHVKKAVPDRFLDTADQIKLVDIPAEELIRRFHNGKVIVPELVDQGLRNFFRSGNINALRELALRYTARTVGKQIEEYRNQRGIDQPWPVQERVMACISSSPFAVHVLRQARQIASDLNAELISVYVEPPSYSYQSGKELTSLRENLQLAEDLGAKVVTLSSQDVASGIINLARKHNVSQIILGKPLRPRWQDILRGSVVDDIIRGCTGIGVFVVPGHPTSKEPTQKEMTKTPPREKTGWTLAFSLLLVALVMLIGKIYGHYLGLTNIGMLYLLPVVFASASVGLIPSIIVAIVSVLSFDLLFVPPVLRLAVNDVRYLITFAVFMIVAFTTGNMSDRLRLRMREAIHRETRTKELYDLARGLSAVTDLQLLASIVVNHIAETADAEVVMYLPEENSRLRIVAASTPLSDLVSEPNESDVADWSFRHSHRCGASTDTLPGAKGFYLPVKTEEKILGVLGIKPMKQLTPEQINILDALAGLAALGITRLELADEAQNIKTLEESERLSAALFNSISHDMKTPLASILGAVSSLVDDGALYNADQKMTLLISIRRGALRMNRVVSNLLDMARLESGYMRLNMDWCDIQDIIGVTLRENREILHNHYVKVEIPEAIRLIKADYGLIEQVLTNLLHNAVKYSPSHTDIFVRVEEAQAYLMVSVIDQGKGIAAADEERVFEKFYRLQSPGNVSGTGLGLSICRGIIEAHGGRIWAKNRPDDGTIVNFTLPVDDTAPRSGENELEGGFIDNRR